MLQQAAREDRHVEMRRLRSTARRSYPTRLDRRDTKAAVAVGHHPAEARERRIERLVLRIIRMRVASMRVRLPDFDDGVADRDAVGIDDPALDRHPVSANAFAREIVGDKPRKTDVEIRTNRLRRRGFEPHVVYLGKRMSFSNGVSSRPRNTMSNL